MRMTYLLVILMFALSATNAGADTLGAGDTLVVGVGGSVQEQCDNQPVITDEFRADCDAKDGKVVYNQNYKGCILSFICYTGEDSQLQTVQDTNTGISGVSIIKAPKGSSGVDSGVEVTAQDAGISGDVEAVKDIKADSAEESNAPAPLREGSKASEKASSQAIAALTKVIEKKYGLQNATAESATEESKGVIKVKGKQRKKLLGLIGVDVETEVTVDPSTGETLDEKRPWWSFMAR